MKKQSEFFWLFHRIRPRLFPLILMTASGIGASILGVCFALGTKNVINSAVSGTRQELIFSVVTLLAIVAGIVLCSTLYRCFRASLAARLDWDWKNNLSRRILYGDYGKISEIHSGEILNRLNNDVRTVIDGILDIIPGVASMSVKLIASVAVLFTMEPVFTGFLLCGGIIVVAVTGFVRQYLKNLNKSVSAANGKVSGFLQEVFEKLLPIQAMKAEQEVENRGDSLMRSRYCLQKKRWQISVTANTCVSILGYSAGFTALVWCAFSLSGGSMTFGELTAVLQLAGQIQTPFVNLSGIVPKYIAVGAACERLMELEEACGKGTVQEPEINVNYRDLQEIRAENLVFTYGRNMVLKTNGFSLPTGSFSVVTGPSGIGKSTLLKLLLGIFPIREGKLFFSGKNGPVTINARTRKLFAYVPQGNLLFSGTIRDNLILTKPDADEEQIRKAIYISGMDLFLPELPEGLETMLGENSHGLSEGQAQRLSIARAVLGGAPILLLDECTSALDAETEEIVLQRISRLPGKTCIAVTHRPAAARLADWCIQITQDGIFCEKCKTDNINNRVLSN